MKRSSVIKHQSTSHLQVFVDWLAKQSKIFLHNHLVHCHVVFKIVFPCNQLREKVIKLTIKPSEKFYKSRLNEFGL